jgi:DNA repair protein SbcC/Rad50
MIPTRVSLKNFLTFAAADDGTPITFDFVDATLWSIAGVNGAGKSAIFDAITYALFGEHRGGRQQDNRLIRKGATTAEVVFEFLQGGERYRVERSVTRKVGRQGQVRPDSKHVQGSLWSDADGAWVAVPDTDKPTELERWLRTRLGMGPETFSSSVLLRQGEADKLLNAKASQRFRILAGLIDLRVYQRLEQLAIERRKAADATTEALDQQLADVEEVTDDQLAAAGDELTAAAAAVAVADTGRVDADRRWTGAQRHAELLARRKAQVARRDALSTATAQADAIRAAAAERRHLDVIAEPVTSAFQDLVDAGEATTAARNAATRRDAIELDALDLAVTQAAQEHEKSEENVESLTDRHSSLVSLRSAASDVLRCRREHAARVTALAEFGDPADLRAQAEQLEADLRNARTHLAELENQRNSALGRHGAAKGALKTARARLAQLDDLADEPTCSRCNQPITAQHLESERAQAQDAIAAVQASLDAETALLGRLATAIDEAKVAADGVDGRHRGVLSAAEAAKTAHDEVRRAQAEIDEATRVVNASVAAESDASVAALVATVLQEPLDRAAACLLKLAALEASTQSDIATARTARAAARKAALASQKALEDARRERAELERQVSVQAERATQLHAQADLRLRDVPPEMAAAIRSGDRAVLTAINERRECLRSALDDLAMLERAEQEVGIITATLGDIERDLAEIPAEHQIPVADARALLDAAQEALVEAHSRRDRARDDHCRLAAAHRTRAQLAKKLGTARHQARVARRLAGLLGRSELQGRLLTEATTGVEAYANDALARISGGTLELELRRDDSGDGANLDIFVKDRGSADEPLEVAFISGSQKFRVAVALAAGLGQYLGGDTAIRSLIIDEGFGSLDADGRQRMIEELRALSEHLDRIIVVSHQEDFSDRTLFPNGFVLRKDGTKTVVERVG